MTTPRLPLKETLSIAQVGEPPTDLETVLTTALQRTFERGDGRLSTMLRYATHPPGKLLRPRLLLQFCELVGGEPTALVQAGVAVELGHLGSLVHDDIIDDDDVRHGKRSVPHEFGVNDAIVAGDGLFFRMFGLFSELAIQGVPAPAVVEGVRIIAGIGQRLCEGQLLEASVTRLGDFSADAYTEVIEGKTASYFSGVAQVGTLLGGGSEEARRAASKFGTDFGVAFQMVDDLLPFRSTDSVAGKPLSSDLQNGRITFPLVVAHRLAGETDRSYLREQQVAGRDGEAIDFAGVRCLLERVGAFAVCKAQISRRIQAAASQLDVFPQSKARSQLAAVLDGVESRVS